MLNENKKKGSLRDKSSICECCLNLKKLHFSKPYTNVLVLEIWFALETLDDLKNILEIRLQKYSFKNETAYST